MPVCTATNDWRRGLPKEPGEYWAWCMYDGDMMIVTIQHDGDKVIVRNESMVAIGIIGGELGVTPEQFDRVASHYMPYVNYTPLPPKAA